MDINKSSQELINIILRVIMLFFILAACFVLLKPFGSIILWGIILSLAAYPLFKKLENKLGGRKKLAVFIIIGIGLLILIIPSGLFLDSAIGEATKLKENFNGENFQIPLPNARIADWPLIGDKVYELWTDASQNLEGLLKRHSKIIIEVGNFFLKQAIGIGSSIGQFFIATIVAGIILLLPGVEELSKTFIKKIAGDKGEEIVELIKVTVINVLKGIFGMAIIQATLLGIGLLLAGVPHAGLWTLLVFIFSVLQIPALIIVIPSVLYLFSEMTVVPAILWSIYLLLAGASDNILKPILLGKGAPVPMLVIFLGVLGGFITFGFVGLFTGAILLSIGYKLFISWLQVDLEGKN